MMNIIKVDDIKNPDIQIFTSLNEKQVKKIYEPDLGLFICESEKVISRAIDAGYEAEVFFVDEERLDAVSRLIGDESAIPVYTAPAEVMKNLTGYALTGGVLAAMKRKALESVDDVLKRCRNIVVLDDVENPTNIGAIFRSAAALGADCVLLTAGCADPLYRRAARVSMGTVFQVDWTYAGNDVITKLKKSGFNTMALALSDDSIDLGSVPINGYERKAVVMGNEDHGISKEFLEECDSVIKIPMKAGVDSLNVAAASAVAFWEAFK